MIRAECLRPLFSWVQVRGDRTRPPIDHVKPTPKARGGVSGGQTKYVQQETCVVDALTVLCCCH